MSPFLRRLMNRKFDNRLVRWTGFSWNTWLDAVSRGKPYRSALLLTTIGAKTGQERHSVLPYFRDGENIVVIGSNAGADKDPAWVGNLVAEPRVMLTIRTRRKRAIATVASPEDRARLFAEACRIDPIYAEYQKRTRRRLPVILFRFL